ncbi:MAG: ABC transporter substrate binding protein [Desulfosarcinaceae bacterium]|nr:ABC transporter substrate binding protein [Desulfosarcinaceae bacterium]
MSSLVKYMKGLSRDFYYKSLIVGLILAALFSIRAYADERRFSTTPTHPAETVRKWRIGYLQGGDYIDYKETLLATVRGLIDLGWMPPIRTAEWAKLESAEIWERLSVADSSEYLRFVPDAFYDAGWISSARLSVADTIRKRVRSSKDLDLIIAMGTWAGQDLARLNLDTNVLVMTASDPVSAGIVPDVERSGRRYLHAHIDPSLNERQLRLFHQTVKFKKLGMIFEDSVAGRSYAGISAVKRLSNELDFEIITCHAQSDIPDKQAREGAYIKCLETIARQIDALYVTLHGGVSEQSLPLIAKRARYLRLPTFSQSGEQEVVQGLLMSLSRASFKQVGRFEAAIMAKVFNGAEPGQLRQVFEENLSLSLNLQTAKIINYIPTADVLATADLIHHE